MITGSSVSIDYTNWRGDRRWRQIIPLPSTLRFTATPHHQPAQWVFDALDLESPAAESRTFALKDIHGWSVLAR